MIVCCVLILSRGLAQTPKAEIAFTIPEKDLIPEGIAYDPAEKAFYLSSIFKKKILKISAKGIVSDFISSGEDDVQEVLGMIVDPKGFLWACNNFYEADTIPRISNIHVYDTRTKSLVRRYQLTDGKRHLFNDLHMLNSGDVFITDTEFGMLWVIRKDRNVLEEFTKPGSVSYPNGITSTADQKNLIISTARGIVLLNLETKETKPLENQRYQVNGYDGLYRYKTSLIGVQNIYFPESIHQLSLNENNDRIEKVDFILAKHPHLDLPTTGVIAENYFYLIANSQLLQIIGNKGKIRHPDKLNDTIILKIKLD